MRMLLSVTVATLGLAVISPSASAQPFQVAPCEVRAVNPFQIAPIEKIGKPREEGLLDQTDYDACRAEALRTGKHVVVWQGYRCGSSEKQIKDVIHCFLPEGYFRGSSQMVYVLVPSGGRLFTYAEIPVDEVCALTIKQGCAGTYSSGKVTRAQVRASGG